MREPGRKAHIKVTSLLSFLILNHGKVSQITNRLASIGI